MKKQYSKKEKKSFFNGLRFGTKKPNKAKKYLNSKSKKYIKNKDFVVNDNIQDKYEKDLENRHNMFYL